MGGKSSLSSEQELPQQYLIALEKGTLLEELNELFLCMDKASWNVAASQLCLEPGHLTFHAEMQDSNGIDGPGLDAARTSNNANNKQRMCSS